MKWGVNSWLKHSISEGPWIFFHVYIGMQVVLVMTFDFPQTWTPANPQTLYLNLWNLWIMIISSFMHIILVIKRNRCVITYVVPQTKYAVEKNTPTTFLIYFLGRHWEKQTNKRLFILKIAQLPFCSLFYSVLFFFVSKFISTLRLAFRIRRLQDFSLYGKN